MSKPINCDVHDHFEIACMRRATVEIELKTNVSIRGLALDVFARKGKEFLSIQTDELAQEIELSSIEALTFSDDGRRIKVS